MQISVLERRANEYVQPDPHDDQLAVVIGELTADDAEKLWSVLIQLKPHLQD